MAPHIGGTHQEEVAIAQAEAPKFEVVTWWKDPGLRKLYSFSIVICLASATTGYDGSMLNGLQILPVWQNYFNHPTGSLLGLFGSIYSIGSLAGLPFAPYIADRWGRRAGIWAGCSILFVGVAVQSASQDFRMFVASRFFVGFGCTLSQLSSPLLLTELAHPQHRGRVTAVYNCLWSKLTSMIRAEPALLTCLRCGSYRRNMVDVRHVQNSKRMGLAHPVHPAGLPKYHPIHLAMACAGKPQMVDQARPWTRGFENLG